MDTTSTTKPTSTGAAAGAGLRPVAVYTQTTDARLGAELAALHGDVTARYGAGVEVVEFHDRPGAAHPHRRALVERASLGEFHAVVAATRWDLDAPWQPPDGAFAALCVHVARGRLDEVVADGRALSVDDLDEAAVLDRWFPGVGHAEVRAALGVLLEGVEGGRLIPALEALGQAQWVQARARELDGAGSTTG